MIFLKRDLTINLTNVDLLLGLFCFNGCITLIYEYAFCFSRNR